MAWGHQRLLARRWHRGRRYPRPRRRPGPLRRPSNHRPHPRRRQEEHQLQASCRELGSHRRSSARGRLQARGRAACPCPGRSTSTGTVCRRATPTFYIANAAVLVPTFNDPNDRKALGILGELFRDRPVVGIHAVDLVLGFGTVHCLTQQQPQSPGCRRNRCTAITEPSRASAGPRGRGHGFSDGSAGVGGVPHPGGPRDRSRHRQHRLHLDSRGEAPEGEAGLRLPSGLDPGHGHADPAAPEPLLDHGAHEAALQRSWVTP